MANKKKVHIAPAIVTIEFDPYTDAVPNWGKRIKRILVGNQELRVKEANITFKPDAVDNALILNIPLRYVNFLFLENEDEDHAP